MLTVMCKAMERSSTSFLIGSSQINEPAFFQSHLSGSFENQPLKRQRKRGIAALLGDTNNPPDDALFPERIQLHLQQTSQSEGYLCQAQSLLQPIFVLLLLLYLPWHIFRSFIFSCPLWNLFWYSVSSLDSACICCLVLTPFRESPLWSNRGAEDTAILDSLNLFFAGSLLQTFTGSCGLLSTFVPFHSIQGHWKISTTNTLRWSFHQKWGKAWGSVTSNLHDEKFKLAACSYVRSTAYSIGEPNLTTQMFSQWVKENFNAEICIETAR